MRHYFTFVALLFFFSCNAQTFSELTRIQKKKYIQQTKEFIKYIRTIDHPDDPLLLVDKPNMKELTKCTERLFRDSTIITIDERGTIKSQINDPLLNKWDTKLVKKVNIISKDTVTAIFNDRNKRWTYFYKHYGGSFNSYSAPIFFRDYTFCLFYSDNSCGGLCGSGRITLFKKEEGIWKPFKTFCEWIS